LVRPPFIGDDRLQMLELASEPLLAIVAEGHSLADTKSVPSARLAQETWLESDVVTDPVFARYWYFRELRTSSPSVPINAATLEEWLAEIAFGRRVNVVPAGLAEEYRRPGLAFLPVADADAPESCLVLAWRRDNAPPSGNDPGRVRSPTAQRGSAPLAAGPKAADAGCSRLT
jgi:DNA-binding transcriptional LysR family regulator